MTGAFWQATGLLVLSNVFMTFAWYAHLKEMNHRPWYLAALASWGIPAWAALCIVGAVYFVFRAP